jgi:hypothetical protein
MATWLVEYCALIDGDLDHPNVGREILCYRIFPEGDRERWIARTNERLPRDVQEEAAAIMARALSKALG